MLNLVDALKVQKKSKVETVWPDEISVFSHVEFLILAPPHLSWWGHQSWENTHSVLWPGII